MRNMFYVFLIAEETHYKMWKTMNIYPDSDSNYLMIYFKPGFIAYNFD